MHQQRGGNTPAKINLDQLVFFFEPLGEVRAACASAERWECTGKAKFGSISVKPAQINEKASPNSEKKPQKTTKNVLERTEVVASFENKPLMIASLFL